MKRTHARRQRHNASNDRAGLDQEQATQHGLQSNWELRARINYVKSNTPPLAPTRRRATHNTHAPMMFLPSPGKRTVQCGEAPLWCGMLLKTTTGANPFCPGPHWPMRRRNIFLRSRASRATQCFFGSRGLTIPSSSSVSRREGMSAPCSAALSKKLMIS